MLLESLLGRMRWLLSFYQPHLKSKVPPKSDVTYFNILHTTNSRNLEYVKAIILMSYTSKILFGTILSILIDRLPMFPYI